LSAPTETSFRAYLMLSGSALFWSGNFVIGRAFAQDIPPITLSYWRWQLALLIFLPFSLILFFRQWQLLRRHMPWLLMMGLLGVAGFNSFVYQGLQHTTATNALLINSFIPILIIALGWLLPGALRSRRQLAGVVISTLGMLLLIMRGDPRRLLDLSFNQGDLWILLAALDWAVYSIALRWRPADLSPRVFLLATMIIGVALLAPLYWLNPFDEPRPQVSVDTFLVVAYVALFASIGAFLLWNQGIAIVGAARGGQFIHLMPLFGALLAIVFLGERLAWFHLGGGFAIGLGIYLSLMTRNQAGPAVTR
jgi:drug/metabolite transporter (DMT)-like permease